MKATALLKLTYLEMFGHDMSWASFNVLEVMSSSKYGHKKIGYLAAVQSFRPDTEVLMLAENLLKKVRLAHDIVLSITGTHSSSGLELSPTNNNHASSVGHTACHQSLHGKFAPLGPVTPTYTLSLFDTQENGGHTVPSRTGLPRDFATRMAPDQGAAVG